ncbi:MAG: PPC domain-containing protein [Snowella sp.]|nr:PPC domain-containing protein [Snowella sp.]
MFINYKFSSRFTGLLLSILSLIISFPSQAENRLYNPIPLSLNTEINDRLTDRDIPTGEGGFARDYVVELEKGDQVAIDLKSDEFDTVIALIARDGSTVGSNDDGPEGGTNSLLFARIKETGDYIVRVRTFGVTGGGQFTLKIDRLRPVN